MVKRDTGLFFPFLLNFKSGATKRQKWRRGAPPAFFLVFWAHSKAVSQNAKNGEDRHRALVKHGNARAGDAGARNWDARAVRAKENSRSGIHLGKKILTHSD